MTEPIGIHFKVLFLNSVVIIANSNYLSLFLTLFFNSFQGNRWLSFYLELLGSLILLIVSLQVVFQKDEMNPGEGN